MRIRQALRSGAPGPRRRSDADKRIQVGSATEIIGLIIFLVGLVMLLVAVVGIVRWMHQRAAVGPNDDDGRSRRL